MNTPAIVKENPTIVNQLVALVALLLVEAVGWVSLGLGEWSAVAAAVLAAAGVTWNQVTPVSKL
jgi:hypothetical protein